MLIKLITIHVNNMEKSLEFYKDKLGFTEVRRIEHIEDMIMIFLKDEEGGLIELIENKKMPSNDNVIKSSAVSFALFVTDMDETIIKLNRNGIQLNKGPIKMPTGEVLAFIKDPNGVEIEFIEGFKL